MKAPKLLAPNLFGLGREDIRPGTWRLGLATTSGLWAWLALGLACVLPGKLDRALAPSFAVVAAWWLASLPLLLAPGLAYFVALLRDGWPRRRLGWRLLVGVFLVVQVAMVGAWMALTWPLAAHYLGS